MYYNLLYRLYYKRNQERKNPVVNYKKINKKHFMVIYVLLY